MVFQRDRDREPVGRPVVRSDTVLTANFELDGRVPDPYTGMWNAIGRQDPPDAGWVVATDRGTLAWTAGDVPTVATDGARERLRVDAVEGEGLAATPRAFRHALLTGERPWGAARDKLQTLAVAHAALSSVRHGRVAHVGDVIEVASART